MKKDIVIIGILHLEAGLILWVTDSWCRKCLTEPNEWTTICVGGIIGFVLFWFVGLPMLFYGLIRR